MANRLELIALPGFPLIEPGDNLVSLILRSLKNAEITLSDGDVLVIAQKIISKAENRYAYLNQVEPSTEAVDLAWVTDKDPRVIQLILDESVEVVRHRPGVLIVAHRNGYVHANAGIDQSNISSNPDNPRVLLLPEDPDKSAEGVREGLRKETGIDAPIIINDSAGRAWRNGTIGFAIGTSGFMPLQNLIGREDLFCRPLEVSQVAVADELAAAASFLMGQANEASPVVLIRGADIEREEAGSSALIRARDEDLFR